MANFFNTIFKPRNKSVIGIDIGSSSIKIVQLGDKRGKPVLETYGEIALGPYGDSYVGRPVNLTPQKTVLALVDLLREAKITSRAAGISIPAASTLISTFQLPAMAEKQLAQVVPLEAKKYIPVPMSEVALDWMVIPKLSSTPGSQSSSQQKDQEKKEKEMIDILLIAISNDVLARYTTIASMAGLDVKFFEIEMFSAIRSLSQSSLSELVVDIGAATTKVYVVEEGVSRFSHILNKGSGEGTSAVAKALGISLEQAEMAKRDPFKVKVEPQKATAISAAAEIYDRIFSDIAEVLRAERRPASDGSMPLLLIGGGAELATAPAIAGKHFKSKVSLADPFEKIEVPAFIRPVIQASGAEFAVAAGLALRALEENR